MCGIIGYIGDEHALPHVARGLKRLEYRGYDSVGLAFLEDEIRITKDIGEIDDLTLPETTAYCGIGHTRWSTHGKPTSANAHPHADCTGRVAVVHNGIIGNYEALRTELAGHTFRSETDTEVISHLIERELDAGRDPVGAVTAALKHVYGTLAIAVLVVGFNGIVAARRNSPLVIGHGDRGTFVASDVTAFLDQTRDVSYLEDGDVAVLRSDGAEVFAAGRSVVRPVTFVDWATDSAAMGGYEHFMRKEIHEQPLAIQRTLTGRIDPATARVDVDVGFSEAFCEALREIQFVACGTSYHATLYAADLMERYAGVRAVARVASEYRVPPGVDPETTLVVAVTQSGETADTLAAVRAAARAGFPTLGVTNVVGSTITREVDHSLYIQSGPEVGVAATKTFTSQVITLALLSLHLATLRGTLPWETIDRHCQTLLALPDAIQRVLDREPEVRALVDRFADSRAFFVIGREFGYPVALEGSLKIKEITYCHAEGFPAGELKHGPLALVDAQTLVLAILTDGSAAPETLSNVREAQTRDAPVIAITTEGGAGSSLDETFVVAPAGDFEPLVANVFLQLFAYHTAYRMGRPIDKPRNLAKSVTVA
jgi:glucosamine--fructose-6-phosphate aminotransferase (isomerizing)